MNIHELSVKVVQLRQLSDQTDECFGVATGFFFRYQSNTYLVTNHHVVSGKKPGTNKIISRSGAVPGHLEFEQEILYHKGGNEYGHEQIKAKIPLANPKTGKKTWLEHPTMGNSCDVVALKTSTEAFSGAQIKAIECERELKKGIRLNVMDQMFIVGFPMVKEKSHSKYPIYKSGYLASEPEVTQHGQQFYVDAKTKHGMSGSPVVQRERGSIKSQGSSFTYSEGAINFVGIYSGRAYAGKDAYEAELGIVWPFKKYLLPILEQTGATNRLPAAESKLNDD